MFGHPVMTTRSDTNTCGRKENDITRFNQTPRAFESFLEVAKSYVDEHPQQPPFIMINAWNEWVEGSYLLPDRYFGFGYLEAVQHVFRQENK